MLTNLRSITLEHHADLSPSSLGSLSEAKVEYQEVFVNDFAPSEPLKMHVI